MIRQLTEDQRKHLLNLHPALIRDFIDPRPEILVDLLLDNPKKGLEYIPRKQLTLDVLTLYINKYLESLKDSLFSYQLETNARKVLQAFSDYYRNSLPQDLINSLVETSGCFITLFSNISYELWLKNIDDTNCLFKNIPEEYKTEDLIVAYLSKNNYELRLIEPQYLTPSILARVVKNMPSYFDQIPKKLITKELLNTLFTYSPMYDLRKELPESCLDRELADIIIRENINNALYLPEKYMTTEVATKIVRTQPRNFLSLPKAFQTLDIFLIAQSISPVSGIPENFLTMKVILKLAKILGEYTDYKRSKYSGLNSLIDCFASESLNHRNSIDWPAIIRLCPAALIYVEKIDQTKEMLDAFFENAPIKLIDTFYESINLSRITKEHSLFMVGTTIPLLQSKITKKSNPISKKKSVQTQNTQPGAFDSQIKIPDSLYYSIFTQ